MIVVYPCSWRVIWRNKVFIGPRDNSGIIFHLRTSWLPVFQQLLDMRHHVIPVLWQPLDVSIVPGYERNKPTRMIEHPHAFQVHFALNGKVTLLAKSRGIPKCVISLVPVQVMYRQTIAIFRAMRMPAPHALPTGRFLYPLRYLRPVACIFAGKP